MENSGLYDMQKKVSNTNVMFHKLYIMFFVYNYSVLTYCWPASNFVMIMFVHETFFLVCNLRDNVCSGCSHVCRLGLLS